MTPSYQEHQQQREVASKTMEATGQYKTFERVIASCTGVALLLLLVLVFVPSSGNNKHHIAHSVATTTSSTIEITTTTTTLRRTTTVPPTTDTVPPPITTPTFSNPNAQSWAVWLPQVRQQVVMLERLELAQDFSGAAAMYQSLYDLGNAGPMDSSGFQVAAA